MTGLMVLGVGFFIFGILSDIRNELKRANDLKEVELKQRVP
jgi:hypothetical protein